MWLPPAFARFCNNYRVLWVLAIVHASLVRDFFLYLSVSDRNLPNVRGGEGQGRCLGLPQSTLWPWLMHRTFGNDPSSTVGAAAGPPRFARSYWMERRPVAFAHPLPPLPRLVYLVANRQRSPWPHWGWLDFGGLPFLISGFDPRYRTFYHSFRIT